MILPLVLQNVLSALAIAPLVTFALCYIMQVFCTHTQVESKLCQEVASYPKDH